jgi:tRNA uridine 5-carbamoylmethylation protein Kti12
MENNFDLIMLVGMPSAGKSTFRRVLERNMTKEDKNVVVLSTDDYIDRVALRNVMTYDQVFQDNIVDATAEVDKLIADVNVGIISCDMMIWDQTNLSVASRKEKLRKVCTTGQKISLVFPLTLGDTRYEEQLEKSRKIGKNVPMSILKKMSRSFVLPTQAEGFDAVYVVE